LQSACHIATYTTAPSPQILTFLFVQIKFGMIHICCSFSLNRFPPIYPEIGHSISAVALLAL
jgi:hypothetical protein